MEFVKRLDLFDKLAILFTFLFILSGSIVSVIRFWQYEIFYYDFGIFDNAIWKVAHFQAPIGDHYSIFGKWIFADHFSPGIFLLSPIYWIFSSPEALLIVQALVVGLSGFVLYLIGIEVLKNKFASFSVLVSYFLFLGLQNAVISDFHEVTVATLPLAFTFYAIVKKNLKVYVIGFLATLLFKETMFILGAALGIFIILFNRKWTKVGLFTVLFSLLWGFFAIQVIIPYFSKSAYSYGESLNPNPFFIIKILIDSPLKIRTIFFSFLSFGFLPLFSPVFWIIILQDLIVRFYSPLGVTRIGLTLHYSALLSVIMGVASLYGLKFISPKISSSKFKYLLILLMLNSIFLYRFILHGPLALSYNPDFYKHTKDFKFLDQLVQKVPKGEIVMAQNNIAPHFIHTQKEVLLLRTGYSEIMPDYIVLDLRSGQNANDFFNIGENGARSIFELLKQDRCYKVFYSTADQHIYQKIPGCKS